MSPLNSVLAAVIELLDLVPEDRAESAPVTVISKESKVSSVCLRISIESVLHKKMIERFERWEMIRDGFEPAGVDPFDVVTDGPWQGAITAAVEHERKKRGDVMRSLAVEALHEQDQEIDRPPASHAARRKPGIRGISQSAS
jgi:hypothetical protein